MKKTAIYLLGTAFLLAGCNAVDLEPTNKYDGSFAFKSAKNAELYLNSFYQETATFGQFGAGALCGGSNGNMSDGLTDILKYGSIVSGVGDCNLIMTVDGQQSVTQNFFDAWTSGYGWIRRQNEFLSSLETYKSQFDEATVKRYRAEVLYFRAFNWFLLMRSHASEADDLGVILRTSLDKMTADTKDMARASVSESWNQFEEDINYAIENLPEPSSASGRLHKYAALALKARGMLYAKRYAKAQQAAKDIIDSGLYEYSDDYLSIFHDINNPEVIWGYGFTSATLTHSFDQKYSMPSDICDHDGYGSGYAGPTQEFVDSFDNADGTAFDKSDASKRYITRDNVGARDPRLAACVLYNGALWKGKELACYDGGKDQKYMPYGSVNTPGNTVTGYYMRKFLDESNHDFRVNGSYQPWIEFRYAEIKLIYAECLAADNKFAEARDVVEELRKVRFGRDDVYTAPVSDFDSALDLILKERSIDLCYEGHRFWDLRRTGRARSVLNGKKYTGVLWSGPAGPSAVPQTVSCEMGSRMYPERFDRFPIPQSEINNNTLAHQNKDW